MGVALLKRAILGTLAAAAVFVPAQAQAANLIADYRFDDNLDSSVGTAPALSQLLPPGSFATATVDGQQDRVLSFAESSGVRAPLSAFPDPASYSTIVNFEFDDVSDYRRILAFDTFDADNDNGLYDFSGQLDFYDEADNDGADETLAPNVSLAENTYADVAFTRSADGSTAAYTNGTPQLTHADTTGQSVIRLDGLRYFKDNSTGEESAGSVARIRIYNGALTATEVLDIEQTGGMRATAAVTKPPAGVGKKKRKPKAVDSGLTLTCPAEDAICPVAAQVTAKKKGKAKVIGTFAGDAAPGASTTPTVTLSKRGRKLAARKGKLKISVSATITAATGVATPATNAGKI